MPALHGQPPVLDRVAQPSRSLAIAPGQVEVVDAHQKGARGTRPSARICGWQCQQGPVRHDPVSSRSPMTFLYRPRRRVQSFYQGDRGFNEAMRLDGTLPPRPEGRGLRAGDSRECVTLRDTPQNVVHSTCQELRVRLLNWGGESNGSGRACRAESDFSATPGACDRGPGPRSHVACRIHAQGPVRIHRNHRIQRKCGREACPHDRFSRLIPRTTTESPASYA